MELAPSQLPSKDLNKGTCKSHLFFYFSFLPFNQFEQAESEWLVEDKAELLGADPPGNSLCTLLRLVRLEKRFNNKLYRTRNVQKCQGGSWLVSCLPVGVSYTHQSCAEVLELTWRAARVSLGNRCGPGHPAAMWQQTGARACAQVPQPPGVPWLLVLLVFLPPASMSAP